MSEQDQLIAGTRPNRDNLYRGYDISPNGGPHRNSFWGVDATPDEVNSRRRRDESMQLIADNRDHIMKMADKYKVDELVLANVLYQEHRHRDAVDDRQDANRENGRTLGPGQMTVRAFHDLVKEERLTLTPDQQERYNRNRDEFAMDYIIGKQSGIEATAALIRAQMDRQQEWGKFQKPIDNDGDPRTLSLGQFVYGAALYSKAGRSGEQQFDYRGPTTDQIDLKHNDLSGLYGMRHAQSMINAFRYLPDTYQALYGVQGPPTLGGYFNDRTILREGNQRSSADGNEVAPAPGATPTLSNIATTFGQNGELGRQTFDNIAQKLMTQQPELGAQTIPVAADLTPKSMLAGIAPDPNLTRNDSGRIFAFDPNRPDKPVVFADAANVNMDNVAQNAEKTRALNQNVANAQTAEQMDKQQALEARSRGPTV
jgi:hypothetical protein